MQSRIPVILALMAAIPIAVACEDDDPVELDDTFDLTFEGDASYQAPHGGHAISVALISAQGTVLETMSGTVSSTETPAFSFTFEDALTEGASYRVEYWIDSNFGGGTAGVCDPVENDHQWRLEVGTVVNDVVLSADHDAEDVVEVCDSF